MTHLSQGEPRDEPRPLTGRAVLIGFLAFFGVVIAVNATMIRLATTTFGGLEAPNAYKAGLAFQQELDAAGAQQQRHWRVDADIRRQADGRVALKLDARDAAGRGLAGLDAVARLVHPADSRRDQPVDLTRLGNGTFNGTANAEAGGWLLEIDLLRNAERVFRSRSRIVLR